ncbi:hypothetical protein [uncultured Eubacterium sp.]|uniref:hypothetical protein n=1 Tax=uncultured Eubacterium sp. TaxID=165185 RepID=UPI0025CD3FC2|nr:hypothetical protein [uncultured Eubacterium sp.]
MKKFSIRFVSIILSLILVISSLPLTVLSVSAADGDTATTNLAASDVAYCGTGVGFDNSNKCVRFPEQGYTAIKHCEFTFTGTVSGGQAVGTFSSDALGYTKYVNIGIPPKQPLKTTADTLTVAFNTVISNTFSIYSSKNDSYLFFHDKEWSGEYYKFDRFDNLRNTQTAFSLFVRESGNTTSGINGYKRVQNINEIKQGEKYLIAHPGKYDRITGNAADGSAWYVLHPSKADTDYVQVAKVYNTVLSSKAKRIQNGSFEYNADGSPYVQASGNHSQPQSYEIQAWNTTAEENKVELFNKSSKEHMSASDSAKNYIPDGSYAAELNADEPGSLYQVVNTMPSSAYLWGLDHRGRSGVDTMALVIGPNQEVRPSKNSGSTNSETTSSTTKKNYGKDQFMQMVEWAKSQEKIKLLSDYSDASGHYGSNTSYKGLQNITVYSKPFGLNGSFNSSDELSPFSLVPTDEHTEEWHIWIMTSGSGDWSSYGSNDEKNGINIYGNINSSDMEKLKQFFYRVPAGQTESMFAFVPIDTAYQHRGNKTTLGNLLDNVNFEVFNSFTVSSTNHGAGSLTDNDNGSGGDQDITDTHPISVYTKDNSTQNLVAEIKKEDSGKDVTFAGVYLTTQNAKGESVTVFKPLKNCEIEVNEGDWKPDSKNEKLQTATVTLNGKQVVVSRLLTDNKGYVYDIPADMWLKTTDSNGNTDYVMQIKNVSSSMDAHFIFLKSPTVTYDANSISGFEYKISDTNTTNVYNFEPIANADGVKYIDPVSSHPPVAPNDGWKFTGWKLFDTNGVVKYDNGNDVILSGTNAIACNTTQQENGQPTRTFIVVDGKEVQDAFNEGVDVVDSNNAIIGKEWTVKDGVTPVYNHESEALSLVAQWRFKNTFTPEYKDNVTDDKFTKGETGGTIELKNTDSENYSADQNGTKSYFAGVGEQVVATAKENSLYTFIGWYDSEDNVVTTNPELVVNQVKGEIGKYSARFQKTGVTVNFYYLEYNKDTKSYEPKVYDGGKYTQYLNKNGIAKQPTGDSKKVKTWYTSRTNLGADTAFDFNKTLDKSIDLYAAPAAFTFNYLNQFQFAEPWRMITYATLKYDGKYIDMKNDPDVTDYKVYILKASSVDEKQPTSADIKKNTKTQVVSKDQQGIMFDGTTGVVNAKFNRIGTKYNNLHIFDMKTPVWVTFEFTYRGITYTANVKNRSLYNNIDTYMKTTGQQYYTEYGKQQEDVLNAIKALYDATVQYKIPEATNYHSSVSVSDDVKNSVKTPDAGYTFNSSTTIRNIEPWGFKYSFSVNGKALSNYSDYGVVVLSGADNTPANASELVNNEKAVMYSKLGGNIYGVDGDANTAVAYHVNGITIANYDKPTYAVFFVRDSNGDYHYSEVISNSYKEIAEKDTSESKEVSTAILNYAQKYNEYVDAISSKNN